MQKLIIDREKWLCGGKEITFLFSYVTGKKCCLGFLGNLYGYNDEEIKDKMYPSHTLPYNNLSESKWPLDLFHNGYEGPFFQQAIGINDNNLISDNEREKQLIELFKDIEIELEFVN